MPWSIEYLADPNVVLVVSTGDMDYQDYKNQTEEAIFLSRENGTGYYLNDVRHVNNRAKLSDIFRINRLYSEFGQAPNTKLALLIDREQKDYNTIKIFEISCTIRGWNVRSFLRMNDALDWLTA